MLDPKSKLKSLPVNTANGRPEATSQMGDTVKSAKTFFQKPSSVCLYGLSSTALTTQRCRWSKVELERSRSGRLLSCGASSVCRSVESSIACDHVQLDRNSKCFEKRFEKFTVSP